MQRHEALGEIHRRLAPRTYLEVGVSDGRSLALSRCRSIGVDPAFAVKTEIACDVALYRQSSDDFFSREHPLTHFGDRSIDLAFIDGMHLFEFALRDFINIERYATPYSVIVFDDVLPRSVAEAARDRTTREWTGDVFKVAQILAKYRPDLSCVTLDSQPTGLLVVFGADPESTALARHYDDIVAAHLSPDPQQVPPTVLRRGEAIPAASLLRSDVWTTLATLRDQHASRATVLEELSAVVPSPSNRARGLFDRFLHRS
jgi:hypothetical protein